MYQNSDSTSIEHVIIVMLPNKKNKWTFRINGNATHVNT